jgi:hypothetical protein
MTRDLVHRPVLGAVEAMNGIDLLCRQHAPRATHKASRVAQAIGMFLSRRITCLPAEGQLTAR